MTLELPRERLSHGLRMGRQTRAFSRMMSTPIAEQSAVRFSAASSSVEQIRISVTSPTGRRTASRLLSLQEEGPKSPSRMSNRMSNHISQRETITEGVQSTEARKTLAHPKVRLTESDSVPESWLTKGLPVLSAYAKTKLRSSKLVLWHVR